MEEYFLKNINEIRISIFLVLFIIFASWEIIYPDYKPVLGRKPRWISNILLVVFNNLIIKLIFPFTAIFLAEVAELKQWGVLNIFKVDKKLGIVLGIVFLDFIIYIQHVVFHAIPLLWRFHQMHHADLDLDVTSGTRFHPVEIFLSMLIKFSSIIVIGASPLSVLLFEIILNAMAMFNHSNINIPQKIDQILKLIVVTPRMHRIHHSIHIDEYNSNFGFNLSIWDRLMGTLKNVYRGELVLGLPYFRDKEFSRLDKLWLIPFLNKNKFLSKNH
jgi:sterol desaturase/sphingolipid hydroxylase (fatty acid hydroxylase superfamily)